MFEVELKLPVPHIAALARRLHELQVPWSEVLWQRDLYFNHPHRDFRQTDEAFRLRSVQRVLLAAPAEAATASELPPPDAFSLAYLTYKGPKLDLGSPRSPDELVMSPSIGRSPALLPPNTLSQSGGAPTAMAAPTVPVAPAAKGAHPATAARPDADDRPDAAARREIELPVDPTHLESLTELWAALSFRLVAEVRKRRQVASMLAESYSIILAWDRVDRLGDFLEIETMVATESEIPAAARFLERWAAQLPVGSHERRSYLELLLAPHLSGEKLTETVPMSTDVS